MITDDQEDQPTGRGCGRRRDVVPGAPRTAELLSTPLQWDIAGIRPANPARQWDIAGAGAPAMGHRGGQRERT